MSEVSGSARSRSRMSRQSIVIPFPQPAPRRRDRRWRWAAGLSLAGVLAAAGVFAAGQDLLRGSQNAATEPGPDLKPGR